MSYYYGRLPPPHPPPPPPPPSFIPPQHYEMYQPPVVYDPPYYHHQSLPKRPKHHQYTIHRSLSTGNMRRRYIQDMQQQYIYNEQEGYDWYEEDHQRIRRERKKKRQQKNQEDDLRYFEELDGEPLNELELLALKNAAINKRKSKIAYTEQDTHIEESQIEADNQPTIETMMDSLTIVDSNSSSLNTTVENEPIQPEKSTSTPLKKKKRWPLSFLFKKNSTPPTPILSPSSNGSVISSLSSNTSVSPFQTGFWAFRQPMTNNQVWIRFDSENQKRLSNHVNHHPHLTLELCDSNFASGNIPMLVMPSRKLCYYRRMDSNQYGYLELALIN